MVCARNIITLSAYFNFEHSLVFDYGSEHSDWRKVSHMSASEISLYHVKSLSLMEYLCQLSKIAENMDTNHPDLRELVIIVFF